MGCLTNCSIRDKNSLVRSNNERRNTVPSNLCCSFCRKSRRDVKKLIAGPTVYICNECIELCIGIVYFEECPGYKPSELFDVPIQTLATLAFSSPDFQKTSIRDLLRGLSELWDRCGKTITKLTDAERKEIVALQHGRSDIPIVDLSVPQWNPDILKTLPLDFCEANNVVVIEAFTGGKFVTLAVAPGFDTSLAERVQRATGRMPAFLLAHPRQIRTLLAIHYPKDPEKPPEGHLKPEGTKTT